MVVQGSKSERVRREIVVGVDGSLDSDLAVRWAVRAAAGTLRPLRFVHSEPRMLVDPLPPEVESRQASARRLLDDSAALARRMRPELTVSTQLRQGLGLTPAAAMTEAGAEAALLVVGARGHGAVSGLVIGSISQHAARHAACPVVAVRAQSDPGADRIVVGVDLADGGSEPLGLAFELADAFGAPISVVHAWHYVSMAGPTSGLPLPGSLVSAQTDDQSALDQLIEPWRSKFPEVAVDAQAVPGSASGVLNDASQHAALVVVGSRGRGALTGILLGSVSQSVLHHAGCPVVVAR
jgi:nucleotide-binding universal stress UspA family protein